MLKSIRFYLNYLLSGKYGRYVADFSVPAFRGFRALIVTTSAQRIANIKAAAAGLPFEDKAKRFVWLTSYEQLSPAALFESIWQAADPTDLTTYKIA